MDLSSQIFAEVVAGLKGAAVDSAAGAERRRASRMQIEAKLQITPTTGPRANKRIDVLTRDISYSGLGFLAGIALAAGQEIIVHVPRRNRPPVLIRACVRFAAPLADGIHVVGAHFTALVSADDEKRIQENGADELRRIRESILF